MYRYNKKSKIKRKKRKMYPVRMLLKSKTYYRRVLRTLPNIKDGVFCENEQHLKAVNYFRKRLGIRCFIMFWSHLCMNPLET